MNPEDLTALLAELEREQTPEETRTQWEDLSLPTLIQSLARNSPPFGEGDTFPMKAATEALQVIHRQLTRGTPSPEALAWLAKAIDHYLTGKAASLDIAFRVKRGPGRRPKDPAQDEDVAHEYIRSIESGLSEKESLRAAYRLFQRKKGADRADEIEPRSLDKRIDETIIPILIEWGYYRRPTFDRSDR